MATIVHVSDLHLESSPGQMQETIEPLVEALALVRAQRSEAPDLLAITGDLFDTATVDPQRAVTTTRTLLARIDDALGHEMPAVILPGNHDRRTQGLLAPYRRVLFDSLRATLGERVLVAGCQSPFLAEVVPRSFHGMAASVACVDSTYVPTGLVSAGGVLRQEDLLEVADLLRDEPAGDPLVLLTHHHLIPTPLTDLSRIDTDTKSRTLQFLASHVLAGLVSNADHEEWMMTALGAGTALSTLHTLDRALVVLHGHKHYPAVRVVRGTAHHHGDIVLVAAGSAGLVLQWDGTRDPDSARLWPSFNLVELRNDLLSVDTIAFSFRRPGRADESTRIASRPLLRASRAGVSWSVEAVDPEPANAGPSLLSNEAIYRLDANAVRVRALWDCEVERSVRTEPGAASEPYVDGVDAAPFANMTDLRFGGAPARPLRIPTTLRIPTDGTVASYRISGGLCRSLDELVRVYGPLDAFEWVDLLNRYRSRRAILVLEGLPPGTHAFGSALDLTTGQERPVPVSREAGRVVLEIRDCPPRTQLRIIWRPER